METNFKNLVQLLDYYKDEETCKQLLAVQRWGNTPACPHCGSVDPYVTKRGYKCRAKECRKDFTVTVGTIFENTKIKLRIWFAAIYLITSHKKGISSVQLAADLGVTQKTAWFMLHRIREMLAENAPDMLEGVVEVDETYVGGKNKNRHYHKKVPNSQGRSTKDKTPVFGAMKRSKHGNKVKLQIVEDASAKSLGGVVRNSVVPGSILLSDEWRAYRPLAKEYAHAIVNHSSGEYVRGYIHTNSIENFWSLFKRGIIGIYHYMSPKHLHRYCNEFAFRYNERIVAENVRFSSALQGCNTRLKYADLIA